MDGHQFCFIRMKKKNNKKQKMYCKSKGFLVSCFQFWSQMPGAAFIAYIVRLVQKRNGIHNKDAGMIP